MARRLVTKPRSHCKRGHEMVGDNVVWVPHHNAGSKRYPHCRACKVIASSMGKQKKKTPPPAPQKKETPPPAPSIDPSVELYREELARYQAKEAARLAAVHTEVQRRLARFDGKGSFYMERDVA